MTMVPSTTSSARYSAEIAARKGAGDSASGPMYFGRDRRLFGWYHAAIGAHRDCGIVICNPLGYEELCAHRALRHWADALALDGFPTLRFDYDGTGNSAGSDTDPTRVSEWLVSIQEAADELRTVSGVQQVALIGIRIGGTLALAAADSVGAESVVLVGAHAAGRGYAREIRALGRLMSAMGDDAPGGSSARSIDQVAGFTMTAETMADLAALDPLAHVATVRRALVVPRDDVAADMTVADRLAERGVDVDRAMLPGYSEMMVDAHESVAPREIIDRSVRWLAAHYASATLETPPRGATGRERVEGPTQDGVVESAIVIDAANRLFGVLSESASSDVRCATGLIVANAGSVHTVGPGRLYVELAREWAACGFSVLRMDIGGVGDSDARADTADNHPYPDHAVDDLATAARWMLERGGVDRVVIAGLCSGAHASFHAGLELDDIAGIVVINPIVFYWNPACALDVSAWMNFYESRHYSRSVREINAWVRLVRGQVDVTHAAGVVFRRMREVASGVATTLWQRLGLRGASGENVASDLEHIVARGVDVLLVFSEGDPGLDFLRRRYARDLRLLERNRANFALRVLPEADHTFTRRESRARLAALLTSHLTSRYRGGSATGPPR